ncbi:MAG: nuclear transport factor 2 family protein [Micrococcales bacterium]|nr:nuclear transport factor 2 family protein [Micrococcales bacterium]
MADQGSIGRRARAAAQESDRDLEAVLALERELQSGECRGDPGRLDELLAADFLEIGASGRVWDRSAIMALLAEEDSAAAPIELHDLAARALLPDLVQVLWVSQREEQRAARTSLWRRADGAWRLVYHQGTPRAQA